MEVRQKDDLHRQSVPTSQEGAAVQKAVVSPTDVDPQKRDQRVSTQEDVDQMEYWKCPFCDSLNHPRHFNCHSCLQRKPGEKVDHAAEQRQLPKSGIIKRSFTEKLMSFFARGSLEWTCPNCTLLNGGYVSQCSVCGFRREDAVTTVMEEDNSGGQGRNTPKVTKESQVANSR